MKFAFIATHRGLGRRDGCARHSVSRAQGSMPGELDYRVPERRPTNNCWPGASQRPPQRPYLRRSACLARLAGGRGLLRPTSDRAVDAPRGVERPSQTAAGACGYRRTVGACHGAECARPDIHRRVSEPQMSRGRHRPLDRRRLALRGCGRRSLFSTGRRLVHACDDDRATRHRCARDGAWAAGQARGRVVSG